MSGIPTYPGCTDYYDNPIREYDLLEFVEFRSNNDLLKSYKVVGNMRDTNMSDKWVKIILDLLKNDNEPN